MSSVSSQITASLVSVHVGKTTVFAAPRPGARAIQLVLVITTAERGLSLRFSR